MERQSELKSARLLEIYSRLSQGAVLKKSKLAQDLTRSKQRINQEPFRWLSALLVILVVAERRLVMIRSNVTIYRMRAELHGGSVHFLCQKIRKGRRLL